LSKKIKVVQCSTVTPPRSEIRSIVMSMCVCARISRKPHVRLHQIFCAYVACGCGSVFL